MHVSMCPVAYNKIPNKRGKARVAVRSGVSARPPNDLNLHHPSSKSTSSPGGNHLRAASSFAT